MRVKELIAQLQQHDPELEVVTPDPEYSEDNNIVTVAVRKRQNTYNRHDDSTVVVLND